MKRPTNSPELTDDRRASYLGLQALISEIKGPQVYSEAEAS